MATARGCSWTGARSCRTVCLRTIPTSRSGQAEQFVALENRQPVAGIDVGRDSAPLERSRVIQHGLHAMPLSMNVMEAFVSYVPELGIFQLRQERDHLFSLSHFQADITSPDLEDSIGDALEEFEDGIIYNFVSVDPLEAQIFSSTGVKSFVVGGYSLVRHGSELVVMLLGGERTDFEEMTRELNEVADGEFRPVASLEYERPQSPDLIDSLAGHPAS